MFRNLSRHLRSSESVLLGEDRGWCRGAETVEADIEAGRLTFYNAPDEDIHSFIERTLTAFGVPVTVKEAMIGPTVTQFSLVPGEGVSVKQIKRYEADLQLVLAAQTLRIELPIPGRPVVGHGIIPVPGVTAAGGGTGESIGIAG